MQPSKPLCASDEYTEDLTLREAVSAFERSGGVSYQIVLQSYDVRHSMTPARKGSRINAQTGKREEKGKGEGEDDRCPQLLPSRIIFQEILKGNFNSKQSLRWVI